MLTNEESVHSHDQVPGIELVKEEKQAETRLKRGVSVKHKRRHSDPTLRRSNHYCSKDQSLTCESGSISALRESVSTLSLVPALMIHDSSSLGGGAKSGGTGSEKDSSVGCRSGNRGRSSSNRHRFGREGHLSGATTSNSCHSIETSSSTSSTIDSFELALAVAAKSSPFISPGTRQLLHRLFITIAGKLSFKSLPINTD